MVMGGGGTKRSLSGCNNDTVSAHCNSCNQGYCVDCSRGVHAFGGTSGYQSKNTWRVRKTMVLLLQVLLRL